MDALTPRHVTAFLGHRRLATGSLSVVAAELRRTAPAAAPLLVFDDATGEVVELDLRPGAPLPPEPPAAPPTAPTPVPPPVPAGRGRPRLGVVAREVTLLPRHWEWLATQPGGASVTLRRLVEHARRGAVEADARRQRQERAYRVLVTLAGDLPGFEEASRALFAGDASRFATFAGRWPADVATYLIAQAFPDGRAPGPE